MKNLRKLVQLSFIALAGLGFINTAKAQTISSHYFGVNAWMADTIGTAYKGGKLHKNWGKIKESGATMTRYGGIAPDENKPTKYQYLRVVDSMRAKGLEPLIQVPFFNNRYTAAEAAEIVRYLNIEKARHIKYWIIGNEPNLSYGYTTAAQIAAYIKPFSSAMKNVDPSILIVGPEVAAFKQTILDGLTDPTGPNDITGKDANGRYYVDIISFHQYPMNAGTFTRAECIAKLMSPGALSDNLDHLNGRISAANSAHGRTGAAALKTAITESNVNYNNAPTDNLYGVGANSFFGGQFVNEIYGIGMKKGVDFINLWSVIEGGSDVTNNGGFLDGATGAKKPLYYAFQMMAQNFKGQSINATSNQANVKTFACKNGTQTTVMILNEDLNNDFNYTVRLNTDAATGNNALKINVNSGIAKEYKEVVMNQSTLLLTFNAAGELVKKIEYTLAAHAVAGLPPTVTNYNSVATGVEAVEDAGSTAFDIKVFPNPSVGKFTIALNDENTENKNYDVEVISLLGQEVYKKQSEFQDGKQMVELSEGIAQGAYIVRVKKDQSVITKRIILSK
jgi:hypothetical protein